MDVVDVLVVTLGSFLTSTTTGFLSTSGLTGEDAAGFVVVGVVGVDAFVVLTNPVFTGGLAVIGDLLVVVVVVVVVVVELGSESCRG